MGQIKTWKLATEMYISKKIKYKKDRVHIYKCLSLAREHNNFID